MIKKSDRYKRWLNTGITAKESAMVHVIKWGKQDRLRNLIKAEMLKRC